MRRLPHDYVTVGVDGCWRWRGGTTSNGYVLCTRDGRRILRHRAVYEIAKGPIPEGLQIDHICGVRHCLNPAHLEAVTQAENLRRGKARIIACPSNHAYDVPNTYYTPTGARKCRACRRESMRKPRRV